MRRAIRIVFHVIVGTRMTGASARRFSSESYRRSPSALVDGTRLLPQPRAASYDALRLLKDL